MLNANNAMDATFFTAVSHVIRCSDILNLNGFFNVLINMIKGHGTAGFHSNEC
jgi:hypothetical protein